MEITGFAVLTFAVATLKPKLIFILKTFLIDRIKSAQKRKATVEIVTLVLGAGLAITINIFGGFGLTLLNAILIGTGASYAGSQTSYRISKIKKETNGQS